MGTVFEGMVFFAKPMVQGVPMVFLVLFNLPFIKENSYNIYIDYARTR